MYNAAPSSTEPTHVTAPVPFWLALERFGDRMALRDAAGASVSYAELAGRGDSFARSLPARVALIAIEARNEFDSIVAYVGCLRAGRPVLLLAADDAEQNRTICAAMRPEATYAKTARGWSLQTAGSSGGAHPHGDLAVVLSAPGLARLVRLSNRGVAADAAAIAGMAGLVAEDRTVLTLPFHQFAGMTLLHAHLAAGAAVMLTESNVAEDSFWEFARCGAATSLALVPYHVDVLEAVGLAQHLPPTLRVLIQAGGRLAEERVRKLVRLGEKKKFQFCALYGQTEAPSMAVLSAADAMAHAGTVGRVCPGGAFEIRDEQGQAVAEAGVQGELVYRGYGTMMGYAATRADLARAAQMDALRTGAVAAVMSSGYVRVYGRMDRFAMLNGLRINLDEVEEFLDQAGHKVACIGDDQRLAIVTQGKADQRTIRMLVGARYKIQPSHVVVVESAQLPRDAAGTIRHAALAELTTRQAPRRSTKSAGAGLREAMAMALSRKTIADTDTFTSLGGDSLAFLEVYLALERQLGHVPPRWETRTIAELEALAPRAEMKMRLPFSLLVRLAAVAEVIGLHAHSWTIGGGAFVLLALSGYSMSQFQRANILEGRAGRILSTMFPRLLIAYFSIVLAYDAYDGSLNALWLLLLGNFSRENSTFIEPLWFIPAYLQVVLLFLAIAAIPVVRRAFKTSPWQSGLAFLTGALALRAGTDLFTTDAILLMRSPISILHLFALGWCMHQADTNGRKVVMTVIAAAVAFAFWNTNVGQSIFIAACCVAVLWIDSVSLPKKVGHALTVVGSASFFIYVFHMLPVHVLVFAYPLQEQVPGALLLLPILGISVALGVAAHTGVNWAVSAARRALQKRAPEAELAPEW